MKSSIFSNTHQGVVAEIERLEKLLPEPEAVYEKKYKKAFESQAARVGEGVYEWAGVYAHDTRLLWLRGVMGIEGIPYEDEEDNCEDCGDIFTIDELESTMGQYVCRSCLDYRQKHDPDY